MLLVGDIGGTKTRLALFEHKKPIQLIREQRFLSRGYATLDKIIDEFLIEKIPIEAACFGIAGPVRDDKVDATNLPWFIDGKKLATQFKINKVFLINDLEANAYGLSVLRKEAFFVINKGIEGQNGNQGLLSAGTGLGEAGLFWDGKIHVPFATEGGHASFAPKNELEIELLRFALKKFPHVSYERILSGQGILLLHQFLLHHYKKSLSPQMEKLFKENDPAKIITEMGLSKEDPICTQTLDLFVSIYGAEAGNLALKFLALGGVFIGGGIAPKIIQKFKESHFVTSFIDKGRFSHLLQSIPIKVVLNDQAALLGAAEYLMRKNEKSF